MTVKVNHVYRYAWRFTNTNAERDPTNNRHRLDGADVLVLNLPDDIRANVEALDGTTMRVLQAELTDVASTSADRFASWREPSMAAPPFGMDDSPTRHKLDRDRDVAQSTFDEIAENIARVGSTDEDDLMAGSYSMGVADYAGYLATGVASERLRNLLDL